MPSSRVRNNMKIVPPMIKPIYVTSQGVSDPGAVLPDVLEIPFLYTVYDWNISSAIEQVFKDICNQEGSVLTLATCSWQVSEVSNILIAYVDYMVANTNAKYFYDEQADRTDYYRKTLVKKIAGIAGQTEAKTLKVLVALYWAVKDKRLSTNIVLKPRESGQFSGDSAHGGIVGPLVKSGAKIIDGAGNLIAGAADGIDKTLTTVGTMLEYLPWILGLGAVGAGLYFADRLGILPEKSRGRK